MLNKLKKSDAKGFTIIEVMIVLAIAGLIILIVLLAVPALQRNGRNTAIKQDAAAVAGGISEFSSNNEGAIPIVAGSTCSLGSVSLGIGGSTVPSKPRIQGGTVAKCVSASVLTAADYAPGKLDIDFGYRCNSTTGPGVTPSARATAILYSIETASIDQVRCLDS